LRPTDECALVIQDKDSPSVSSDELSGNTLSHRQVQFAMPSVKHRTMRNKALSSAQSSQAAAGFSDPRLSDGNTTHQLPLKLSKEVHSNDRTSPGLVDNHATEAKFGAPSNGLKYPRPSDGVLHANETSF
jgi:hypothetical protein